MTRRFGAIALFSFSLAFLPPLARADIGAVGSPGPVDVMNRQRTPRYTPPAAPASGALLIVRFNRNHVYYERALMEAVESSRQVKPGASYRIVSTIPVGNSPSQTMRMQQAAQANIQAITQQMQWDGVAAPQIHFETTTATPGEPQEIQIFVQ